MKIDTVGVRGSRPLAPTIGKANSASDCAVFAISSDKAQYTLSTDYGRAALT